VNLHIHTARATTNTTTASRLLQARKEEMKEEFMRNWIQMQYPLKMEQQI